MQLEWTGAVRDITKQRHVMTMEFLQPFTSDGGAVCARYMTCLACMTDTACGWCSGRCIDRLSETLAECRSDGAPFIVNAEYCPVCADHITCSTCLQVCVWPFLHSLLWVNMRNWYKLVYQACAWSLMFGRCMYFLGHRWSCREVTVSLNCHCLMMQLVESWLKLLICDHWTSLLVLVINLWTEFTDHFFAESFQIFCLYLSLLIMKQLRVVLVPSWGGLSSRVVLL